MADYDNNANTRELVGSAEDEILNGAGAVENASPEAPNAEGTNGLLTRSGIQISAQEGNDTLTGSAFDDLLLGEGGNDSVNAGAGNDALVGGLGDDTLNGEAGDDTISGDAGTNIINGGEGNDTIMGGVSNAIGVASTTNTIDGGAGTDALQYEGITANAISSFSESNGTYTITHSNGEDTVSNMETIQFIDGVYNVLHGFDAALNLGDASGTTITGNDDIQAFYAGAGDDTINAGGNTDYIYDGAGDDMINAEAGNDQMIIGGGNNTVDGGDGDDLARFEFKQSAVTSVTVNGDVTTVVANNETNTFQNVENFDFINDAGDGFESLTLAQVQALGGGEAGPSTTPTAGDDTLTGDDANNTIDGLAGNDTINGLAGDDMLTGGAGDDTIDGGDGTDTAVYSMSLTEVTSIAESNGVVTVMSAEGTDTLSNVETLKFNGTDYSVADATAVLAAPAAQRFISRDANNNETIITADAFTGDANLGLVYEFGRNTVGNDTTERIVGSSANDFITLGLGDDAAQGGAGNDVIDGGLGSNFLTGGDGNDVFFVDGRAAHADATDTETWSTITDFTAGDSINIWGYEEGTSVLLNTFESTGAAGFEGVTYQYDLDGDGAQDTTITFSGLSSVPDGSALQDSANENYLLIALA